MLSKEITLRFKYKDSRTYVQGPDIVNSVLDVLNDYPAAFIRRIQFHAPLRNNALLIISSDSFDHIGDNVCSGLISCSDIEDVPFAIFPLEDQHIYEKCEYFEDLITDQLKLVSNDQTVQLVAPTPFTLVEEIVASNKFLNNSLFPASAGLKWLFVGLVLNDHLPKFRYSKDLKLVVSKSIGRRYTETLLYLDNVMLGSIKFALGKI